MGGDGRTKDWEGIRDSVAALDLGLLCSVDSDTVLASDPFFDTKWVCWATKVDDSVAQWTPDRPTADKSSGQHPGL